ncbi:MAG: type IV secretion system DNA-binding domain-containing protein [Sinobacteraceae bacterium]|nr:type IV secretion system DNA-binding domain-containing protein [Nevskiaceae bacterium]
MQAPLTITLLSRRARAATILASPILAAPLTLAAAAGIAITNPLEQAAGWVSTATQLTVGILWCCSVGYAAARILTRKIPHAPLHRRGASIATADCRQNSAVPSAGGPAAVSSVGWRRARGRAARANTRAAPITLGGIPVPASDETKHFKLLGTTGTGKSTAVREILTQALERGDRAVIADPDGGYLKRFYDKERDDLILNPFDRDAHRWDLFGEIETAYDVEQLARSLIPDQGGPDRSWTLYARTFFSSVTRQAWAAGVRDLGELYRLLVVADATELRQLLTGTPAQPFLEPHNMRMFDSIRSVASAAVGSLEYVAQQDGQPLSVRRWVRAGAAAANSRGILFLPYRAGQIAALRSSISAWMRLAVFEAMDQPEKDQRLWFVIDELDALGQIDGLKDALARLRKFGGRCVLRFQSIAQVSATYGSGDAQTIVENCGNSLLLRCSASEHGGTAAFASRLIGQREVLRLNTSRSRRPGDLFAATTVSEHISIEPAVMEAEIEQLPDLQGYLKLASMPQWQRIRLDPPAEHAIPISAYRGSSRPAVNRATNTAAPRGQLHEFE